jgi:ABC-type spermidine/putrescine transport system permease subunit II
MGIKDKSKALGNSVKEKTMVAIAGAFALVIALSWNEFIKEGVTKLVEMLGATGEGWIFKLIAALVTTLICVIGILIVSRK